MKKKFFVFTALIFMLSAGVFAQDLKFDGYLNSGLGVAVNDYSDSDPTVKAYGVDSSSNGFRFRLNGAYNNEAKNAGIRFRLQGQHRIDQSGYFSVPSFYGLLNFLDNKITVLGGLILDSTWEAADYWILNDAGEGLGVLVKAEPVKGLILGAGAYTISQQSGPNNNVLQYTPITIGTDPNTGATTYTPVTSRLPNFNEITLKYDDAKYVFGVVYTLPDTFRLSATFRTKNKAAWNTNNRYLGKDDYPYGGYEESSLFQTELRVFAVKNLTAVIVGKFDKLQDFSKFGEITLSELFAYKIDDLTVGLNAVQFLYNGFNSAANENLNIDPGLLFNIWGSYAVNTTVLPRLDLVYFKNGKSTPLTWGRSSGGFAYQGATSTTGTISRGLKDEDDDLSVFSVRPSVKLFLDSRTFLEIGDLINYDFGNFDGAYKDSSSAEKRALLTNVFYIDVKFTF